MNSYSVVVFGTPANKLGFQIKNIYGNPPPGNPPSYLDKFNRDTMSTGRTYKIESIEINNNRYTLFVAYEPIKPNDSNTSRGAYIGVAIIINGEITINSAIIYFEIISQIHSNLSAYRNEENSFYPQFNLKHYKFLPEALTLDALYLIDTLHKISSGKKFTELEKRAIVYNDVKNRDIMKPIESFHYSVNNSKEIVEMETLKKEIDKSVKIKEVYDRLKVDYNKIVNELKNTKDKFSICSKNEERLSSENIILKNDLTKSKKELKDISKKYDDIFEKYSENIILKDDLTKSKKKLKDISKNFEFTKKEYSKIKEKFNKTQEDKQYYENCCNDKKNALLQDWKFLSLVIFLGTLLFVIGFSLAYFMENKESNINFDTNQIEEPIKIEPKIKEESITIEVKEENTNKINSDFPKSNFDSYQEFGEVKDSLYQTDFWYVFYRIEELNSFFNINIYYDYPSSNSKYKEIFNLKNGKKILNKNERENGMIAIWECDLNYGIGHIGFIEKVDNDKFTISSFEHYKYYEKEFIFAIDKNSKNPTNGYISSSNIRGCLPTFYKLKKR